VDGDQTLVQFPVKEKDDSSSSDVLVSNNIRILPRDQLMVSTIFKPIKFYLSV
jgi:hypothetical protein